jgi:hypothetical protein
MFLKADGSKVWLQSSRRTPYLSLTGIIENSEDYVKIQSRLYRAYKLVPCIASGDAFLVQQIEDSDAELVFCARPDKGCALLLLGKFDLRQESTSPCTVFEKLIDVIEGCVDRIRLQAGVTIRFEAVQPELAAGAFDLNLY